MSYVQFTLIMHAEMPCSLSSVIASGGTPGATLNVFMPCMGAGRCVEIFDWYSIYMHICASMYQYALNQSGGLRM